MKTANSHYHYMTQQQRDLKRRRKAKIYQARKRFRLTMIAVMLVVFISIIGSNTRSKAETVHDSALNVSYQSIMIGSGESLWSIATKQTAHIPELNCKDYVSEIKTINGLTSDNIRYGDYLIIPVYSYANINM